VTEQLFIALTVEGNQDVVVDGTRVVAGPFASAAEAD
jgi:hypothetical protein